METVRKNKIFLIDTLSADATIVLQHVQSDKLITKRDYNNLNQPNYTQEKIIISLLDIVINKGDETCQKFLKLLEKEELQENFPQLKKLFTSKQTSVERELSEGSAMATATKQITGAEFVDKHRNQLIQRVSSVMEIADGLLPKILTPEKYSTVRAAATSQAQMRIVYDSLTTGRAKEEFYKILKEKDPLLVDELEEKK